MNIEKKIKAFLVFKEHYSNNTLEYLDSLLSNNLIDQSQYNFLAAKIAMHNIHSNKKNNAINYEWINDQLRELNFVL